METVAADTTRALIERATGVLGVTAFAPASTASQLLSHILQDSDGDEPVLCRGIVRLAWTTAGAELRFASVPAPRVWETEPDDGSTREAASTGVAWSTRGANLVTLSMAMGTPLREVPFEDQGHFPCCTPERCHVLCPCHASARGTTGLTRHETPRKLHTAIVHSLQRDGAEAEHVLLAEAPQMVALRQLVTLCVRWSPLMNFPASIDDDIFGKTKPVKQKKGTPTRDRKQGKRKAAKPLPLMLFGASSCGRSAIVQQACSAVNTIIDATQIELQDDALDGATAVEAHGVDLSDSQLALAGDRAAKMPVGSSDDADLTLMPLANHHTQVWDVRSHAQEDWLTLVDERAQSGEPFGIIMVLDSCASAESFAEARASLRALVNRCASASGGKLPPVLVLATRQDSSGASTALGVSGQMSMECLIGRAAWLVQPCSAVVDCSIHSMALLSALEWLCEACVHDEVQVKAHKVPRAILSRGDLALCTARTVATLRSALRARDALEINDSECLQLRGRAVANSLLPLSKDLSGQTLSLLVQCTTADERFAPKEAVNLLCSLCTKSNAEDSKKISDWLAARCNTHADSFRSMAMSEVAMPAEQATESGAVTGCPESVRRAALGELGRRPTTVKLKCVMLVQTLAERTKTSNAKFFDVLRLSWVSVAFGLTEYLDSVQTDLGDRPTKQLRKLAEGLVKLLTSDISSETDGE